MNIFKHIITALYKSLYDFKWIAAQRHSLLRAFIYFFVFFFVVIGVRGWFFVQDAPSAVIGYWETFETEIPDFSVEKTDDGLSFVGLDQPFVKEFEEDGKSVLVYIDTVSTSSISVEDVLGDEEEMYAVVVTSQKMKFYDYESGHTDIENVRQLPNFAFSKAQMGEEITKWADRIFPGIFFAGVFFLTLLLGAGKLLYLLALSWLVYVIARADKKTWKFGQVYTIGLYAITIAVLVQWGITFFYTEVPYIYSILALVMMYLVVYKGLTGTKDIGPSDVPKVPEPPKPPKK